MNKYIKTIVISTVFTAFMAVMPVITLAEINGGDDIGNGIVTGGEISVNNPGPYIINGGDDVVTNTPVSAGNISPNSNSPIVMNGGDDINQNPVNPPVVINGSDDTNTNSSTVSRSGGSGFSSTPISLTSPTNIVTTTEEECAYLNEYLRFGGTNPSSEVIKLQLFLRDIEKLDVSATGIFDQKTLDAVKEFQAKYVDEIMYPWGVSTPTGQVWYTTKKKINEIYCKTNLPLTAEQLSKIEAYRKGLENGTINVDANGNIINSIGTDSTLPEVGIDNNDSQTASIANTSFGKKIWNFIKWLFGY